MSEPIPLCSDALVGIVARSLAELVRSQNQSIRNWHDLAHSDLACDLIPYLEKHGAKYFALARSQPGKGDADGWRTIDSAPKDGTTILCYRRDAGVFTASWAESTGDEHEHCWFTSAGEDLTGDEPTHWMPLPAAPAGG